MEVSHNYKNFCGVLRLFTNTNWVCLCSQSRVFPLPSDLQITNEDTWQTLMWLQWSKTNICLSFYRTWLYFNADNAIHLTRAGDDPVQLLYFEDSWACPACKHSCPHNTFPCPSPAFMHCHQALPCTFFLPNPCDVLKQEVRHNPLGRTTWSGIRGSDVEGQASAWRILFSHWLPSNYQSCRSLALPGPRGTSGNFSQEDASVPSGCSNIFWPKKVPPGSRHPIHLGSA